MFHLIQLLFVIKFIYVQILASPDGYIQIRIVPSSCFPVNIIRMLVRMCIVILEMVSNSRTSSASLSQCLFILLVILSTRTTYYSIENRGIDV